MKQEVNPKLDLILERVVDVPKHLIWKGWTRPEQLKKWFVPKPWVVADCDIDLKPGGHFNSVMRSPEGQEFPGSSCYLEIIENRKLVWTSALLPGYRPTKKPTTPQEFAFTAVILLEDSSQGTKYTALALHGEEEDKKTHEQMGFQEGWGTALSQLVQEIKNGNIK